MLLPVVAEKRTYAIQLPTGALADGDLTVHFSNPTVQSASDDRPVGFRLDDLSIQWVAGPLDRAVMDGAPGPMGCRMYLAGCACGAWALRRAVLAPVAVGLIGLLAWMAGQHQLVAMAWTTRLMGLVRWCCCCPGMSLRAPALGTGLESRGAHVRWVCIVTVASIAIRLFAVYYPFWESHDLYIHRDRLSMLQLGRSTVRQAVRVRWSPHDRAARLLSAGESGYAERGSSRSAVAGNVCVLRWPQPTARCAIRATIGWASACRVGRRDHDRGAADPMDRAMVGLRSAGGRTNAGIAAGTTGGATSVSQRTLIWGIFILSLIFLMHPGVAVLTAFCMALYVALVWLLQRADVWWLGWSIVVAVTGIIVTVALYVDVIALQAQGVTQGSATRPDFTEWDRIRLTLEGMGSSLRPVGVMLMVLGAVALLRIVARPQRWFVVAWLGSAALFFAVDLATGLQVRYAYFAIAPLCAGLGVLLDGLMQRGRAGNVVAWSFVGVVAAYGLTLWLSGVFFDIKPTLTALLH